MKKAIVVIMLMSCMLLGGCGTSINYDITDNSKEIKTNEDAQYVNPNDSKDTYAIVTINNRDYIPYGTQGKTITGDMIGECLAYQSKDNNDRYYKVIATDDFVASYYVNGEMMQFDFLRAKDTLRKDIDIPDFIDDLGYDIWK